MDRGQEATGGAIEGVSSILPGRVLTESRQSLHVAPDRTGIALALLRQRERLRGLLLRDVESQNGRLNHCVPRGPEPWDMDRRRRARSFAVIRGGA